MRATTAYALAAVANLDRELAKAIGVASHLLPGRRKGRFFQNQVHRLLIARQRWRCFDPAQLNLFPEVAVRPGPRQISSPPARPQQVRRVEGLRRPGQPMSWRWLDVVANP